MNLKELFYQLDQATRDDLLTLIVGESINPRPEQPCAECEAALGAEHDYHCKLAVARRLKAELGI